MDRCANLVIEHPTQHLIHSSDTTDSWSLNQKSNTNMNTSGSIYIYTRGSSLLLFLFLRLLLHPVDDWLDLRAWMCRWDLFCIYKCRHRFTSRLDERLPSEGLSSYLAAPRLSSLVGRRLKNCSATCLLGCDWLLEWWKVNEEVSKCMLLLRSTHQCFFKLSYLLFDETLRHGDASCHRLTHCCWWSLCVTQDPRFLPLSPTMKVQQRPGWPYSSRNSYIGGRRVFIELITGTGA